MQDLPKFVNTLASKGEQEERCRAIRDSGNFRLTETIRHHLTQRGDYCLEACLIDQLIG